MKAKEDAKKEKEGKRGEKDSRDSDSESPEESGGASQGIVNSIRGLFSRFSVAVANSTESTSRMVLEEIVYVLSHET